jgi:hypothetical protein
MNKQASTSFDAPRAPIFNEQAPSLPADEYEFSADEDKVIGDVATATKLAGRVQILSITIAILQALVFIVLAFRHGGQLVSDATRQIFTSLVSVVLSVIFMSMLLKSSAAFRKVVETRGNDVIHLVEALSHQNSFFKLVKWLLVIGITLLAMAVVVAFLAFGSLVTSRSSAPSIEPAPAPISADPR